MQGKPDNLTGPQTSCQELLISVEQCKECTHPPASELAGQSAEMESDRLKEESPKWGWKGRQAVESSSLLQGSRKHFRTENTLNSTLSPPSLSIRQSLPLGLWPVTNAPHWISQRLQVWYVHRSAMEDYDRCHSMVQTVF